MAKVARSVGRLDFWNLYAEMTPYEIAVTQALWNIEPWGDDRTDLRDAINTVAASGVEAGKIGDALEGLMNYLPVHQQDKASVTPEQSAQMGKAAFARIGM